MLVEHKAHELGLVFYQKRGSIYKYFDCEKRFVPVNESEINIKKIKEKELIY